MSLPARPAGSLSLPTVTGTASTAPMLSILASFAQEESRSISENEKWSIKKRFEQSIPNGHFRIFGYRWEGDYLVPVPEEAAIVKRIFQNFLDGKSRLETEREFAAEGITTRDGCRWVDSNIRKILENCTYTGDLLLQKEFISDPIEKKRKKNRGELPQYHVANHHEPIIDKETFEYVQAEMTRRREMGALANKSLNITCFTGKLKCPHCGKSLMHNHRKRESGTEDYWKCGTTKMKGGRCPVKGGIRDDKLREACARALGLDEFDERAFLDRVDFISVPESYKTEIHMKDGMVIMEDCTPTGHQDCWTEEQRAKASAYRRNHRAMGRKGTSSLTCRIKCGGCGGNYQMERSSGIPYWRCRTKRDGIPLREDALHALIAEVLGTGEYDEAAVEERIDHITVDGDQLVFTFTDGMETSRTWVKPKRQGHKHSEEHKEHMRQIMKEKWTPEKKEAMSEKMKNLRKERGDQWRKT